MINYHQQNREGNFLNLIEDTYREPTVNNMFDDERLTIRLPTQNVFSFYTLTNSPTLWTPAGHPTSEFSSDPDY